MGNMTARPKGRFDHGSRRSRSCALAASGNGPGSTAVKVFAAEPVSIHVGNDDARSGGSSCVLGTGKAVGHPSADSYKRIRQALLSHRGRARTRVKRHRPRAVHSPRHSAQSTGGGVVGGRSERRGGKGGRYVTRGCQSNSNPAMSAIVVVEGEEIWRKGPDLQSEGKATGVGPCSTNGNAGSKACWAHRPETRDVVILMFRLRAVDGFGGGGRGPASCARRAGSCSMMLPELNARRTFCPGVRKAEGG